MRYTLKSELSKSSGIVSSSQMLDLHSRNSRVPQATLWTTTVERPVIRRLPDEVIEDSEPEREESRRRRKEERRKQKELKKPINLEHTTSNSDKWPGSANLEQASNSTKKKLSQTREEPTVLNNLSSPSTTCCNTDGSNLYDPDSMKAKNAVEKRAGVITDLPVSHSVQNVVTIHSESNTSDSEVDERTDKMRTKLGHFAFPVTSQASSLASSISRTSSTVVQSTCSANAPSGVQTKNRKRRLSSTPAYLDFSENQLKTLVKCVSCDLKWTTRKSAAHKVTHMRTCAKKSRLTEETMKILISRETSVAPPKVKKPRPIKDQPSERPQRTYLEDIINEDGIQRPRKRQKELTGSVRGVVESRTGIVERANLILNKPSSSRSTTDDCMRLQPPPQPPPFTQTFAQSTLASRINGISSWSQDEAEPPCTQVLPRSSLLGTSASSRCSPRETCRALDLMADSPAPDVLSSLS